MGDREYLEANLPKELAYLIEPAIQYGKYQFDEEVDAFLETATDGQLQELAALAERVRMNDDYPKVREWLKVYWTDEYLNEAACLDFLFGVLDAADMDFD